jgi:protein SCO1/2
MKPALLFILWLFSASLLAVDADGSSPAPTGGDFVLQGSSGPVALEDFRGQVVLLYFGYASCPDVCPVGLALMGQAMHGLSEDELTKVQGLFISLDPERDTPKRLAEYAPYFHPKLLGLTGDPKQLAGVAARYGVDYYRVELKGSALGYAINHTSATCLIGPDGELQFLFPHETPASVILEAVRYVLDGG